MQFHVDAGRRMSTQFVYALTVVAIGRACIAKQAVRNGRLRAQLGDPVTASDISFIVAAVWLSLIVVARGTVPSASALAGASWWVWLGGVLGAFYVWSSAYSVSTLGVVTLMATLVFGQMVAAVALDAISAFGFQAREVSWTRLAAVVLVAAGLVLSRL